LINASIGLHHAFLIDFVSGNLPHSQFLPKKYSVISKKQLSQKLLMPFAFFTKMNSEDFDDRALGNGGSRRSL
jgi:hypothetical protein